MSSPICHLIIKSTLQMWQTDGIDGPNSSLPLSLDSAMWHAWATETLANMMCAEAWKSRAQWGVFPFCSSAFAKNASRGDCRRMRHWSRTESPPVIIPAGTIGDQPTFCWPHRHPEAYRKNAAAEKCRAIRSPAAAHTQTRWVSPANTRTTT